MMDTKIKVERHSHHSGAGRMPFHAIAEVEV
jgi:hypothetical protein